MMPANPNDTVGASYVSVGGMLGQQLDTAGQLNGTSGYSWPSYGITYTSHTTDYEAREKIAALEGEVRALREMVAALVAGRPQPKPRARKK